MIYNPYFRMVEQGLRRYRHHHHTPCREPLYKKEGPRFCGLRWEEERPLRCCPPQEQCECYLEYMAGLDQITIIHS